MRFLSALIFCAAALPFVGCAAYAEAPALHTTRITEWKAVYGTVEARDRIAARARLGGTLIELTVIEGDLVKAGQPIGRIEDEKLAFQLSALSAQKGAVVAQLANAEAELKRGESLLKQGVATIQGLESRRTQVDVLKGQIAAIDAQAGVIDAQIKEGSVLAPADGRVLDVPMAKGGVVMAGEAVATIAAGGTFLRVSIPERHASNLHQGDVIELAGAGATKTGKLSRIYPLIQNGRVIADVEIEGLPDSFVDARVLVRLPMSSRDALMVPASAVITHAGLDFVTLADGAEVISRTVVTGGQQLVDGADMVEILSGLAVGDHVLLVASEAGHD
ncbi:MAG: efflux RND transporter periplasmic adaptor subunit [Cypionkella sp.]|uniref:efflux RND transporter periplasmic adaptor subunit n=1 Tax=Cypionkella sp. TaxID=2811411 RepID=UPI002ABB5234|nr:efflux RND transporter periplasmic adaptor subunit [Cypionkella sp.]MDZ4311292.1 efflux RND transporter periplasmic adaptor subunit [Cypionkella sp.]